jgi:hypothetical protein
MIDRPEKGVSRRREADFFSTLIKDGRPLISLTGLALLFSGSFALFLTATRQFLPHDSHFLGPLAAELPDIAGGRVASFMFHDRAAFGGSIIAIGWLYLWLAEFPLARRERWAWWALAASGVVGFGSFLTYLGYGYLDSWHGAATLALLPIFLVGLVLTRASLGDEPNWPRRSLDSWGARARLGRLLLLGTGAGMLAAGGTIMTLGMTTVFVPQDLRYMGVDRAELAGLDPRLIPLIAHDRAGFGGGIASCGVLVLFCVWFAPAERSLWQVLALAGLFGFGAAIGVHFAIGYTDFIHLAPAYSGFAMYLAGLAASVRYHSKEAAS